jgi:hypothetical protein
MIMSMACRADFYWPPPFNGLTQFMLSPIHSHTAEIRVQAGKKSLPHSMVSVEQPRKQIIIEPEPTPTIRLMG